MIDDHETQFNNIVDIVTNYPKRPMSVLFNKEMSEASIMSVLFSSSFSVSNQLLTYMLRYKYADVYQNISNSMKYYDADYNIVQGKPSTSKTIVNMDVSYYCSQSLIKYFFLLDILSGIYVFKIDHSNVHDRITIRTRYRVSDGTWMQDNTREPSTFVIKFQYDKITGTSRYVVFGDGYRDMCYIFEKDIVRHLNYMNKVDVNSGNKDYVTNIGTFYMLCRMKLIYYTLLCCNETNKNVSKFIEQHLSYCFLNIKNYVSVKNVNNNSVVLTNKLMKKTNKIRQMNENMAKNNDKIKRNNKNLKAQRHTESKYLLYTCLVIAIVFSVVLFAMYGTEGVSTVSYSVIAFVVVLYVVMNYVIYRRARAVEGFSNAVADVANFNCLNMTKYTRVLSQLTKYPRIPLQNSNTVKQSTVFNGDFPNDLAFNHSLTANRKGIHGVGQHHATGQYNTDGIALYGRSFAGYNGDWIMIDLGESFVLKKFKFFHRDGYPMRAPGKFRIYGTNDATEFASPVWGDKWTLVHDQTDRLTGYVFKTPKDIDISNTGAFSIYVMVVNQLSGNGSFAECLNFLEWELYGKPIDNRLYDKGDYIDYGFSTNVSNVTTEAHAFFEYAGYFYTREFDGEFTFYINADNDSFMWMSGAIVIGNDNTLGVRERIGKIVLTSYTFYPIDLLVSNKSSASFHFSHASLPKTSNGLGHYFPYRMDGLHWDMRAGYQQYGKGTIIQSSLEKNNPPSDKQGLRYEKRVGYQQYGTGALMTSGIDTNILNEWNINSENNFNVEYNGFFFTKNLSGSFKFHTYSDDESFVYITKDNVQVTVVNNGGTHPPQWRSGSIVLEANTYYPIRIRYGESYGINILSLYFEHQFIPKTSNGIGHYFYEMPDTTVSVLPLPHTQIQNTFAESGEQYNVEYDGFFFTQNYSGGFTFFTASDNESFLWINGVMVVNNGNQSRAGIEKSGAILLEKNTYYPIKIRFGNGHGPGWLTVSFAHVSIPKTTNGKGFFFSTRHFEKWFDDIKEELNVQYDSAVARLQALSDQAEDAADMAEEELERKANLEKQYADELNALNKRKDDLQVLIGQNDEAQAEIAEKNRLIVLKNIEIQKYRLQLATADTERARNFAEAERQRALREKQVLTEQQLQDDIKKYEDLSSEIEALNRELEATISTINTEIQNKEISLARARMQKAEEDAKLLAAKIEENANKVLIEQEEMINRQAGVELNLLKYNVEVSKKATEDALKEKQRIDGLTTELNQLDVKFANENLQKIRADQRKQEQIMVTNEARIRANLATEIAYIRKTHYERIKAQLDLMMANQTSNIQMIGDNETSIADLQKIISETVQADQTAQTEAQRKFNALEYARRKENASLRLDILNLRNNIMNVKKQIEDHIKEFVSNRNIIIDTNKTLRETALKLFNQTYRLQQYKFVANILSIENSVGDITRKISANIDNVVMTIANGIVQASMQAESNSIADLDEHIEKSVLKTSNSVEVVARDTKIVDATTRLTLNMFLLTVVLVLANKSLSKSFRVFMFGSLYFVAVFYYVVEVVIIVRTDASKKYWTKPDERM